MKITRGEKEVLKNHLLSVIISLDESSHNNIQTRMMDTKSFLFFSSALLCFLFLSANAERDMIDEPTASLSLVNADRGSRNRFALQVSGDQLTDYLRTLRHVPDSIYNSAHIIADMEESALNARFEDDSQDEGRFYNERIPAMRLAQQQASLQDDDQQQEEEEEDYVQKRKPAQEDDYESSSSRRNVEYETSPSSRRTEYRLPVRMSDYLRSRDLFLRREEAAAAEAEAKVAQLTDLFPAKESSSNPGTPRLKEYNSRSKDLEESKNDEVISVKDQRSKTEIDAPVSEGKSVKDQDTSYNKQDRKRDSSDKEIDLKTVRELLNTLIKQIENIQTAAKALPIPLPAQPMTTSHKRDYNSRDEMDSEADPIPRKVKYSNFENSKKKQGKKPKSNEKTVFLKAHDVVKMLTGSSLPQDYVADVSPIIRRSRGPYMTSLGGRGGVRPFFPMPMPYGGFGGYPGIIGIPFPVQKPCPRSSESTNDDFGDHFTGGYKK